MFACSQVERIQNPWWKTKRCRVQCQKRIQLRDFVHLNDSQWSALFCNIYSSYVDILCIYYIYIQYKYSVYLITVFAILKTKCSTYSAVQNLQEAQDCKRRRKEILRQSCDTRFAEPWTKPALGTWVLVSCGNSLWIMLAFGLILFSLRSFTGRKIASSRHRNRDFYRILLMGKILHHQGWWLSHYL